MFGLVYEIMSFDSVTLTPRLQELTRYEQPLRRPRAAARPQHDRSTGDADRKGTAKQ